MKELDPTDLVRELNDQSDLPKFKPDRPAGGSANVGSGDTIGYLGGCWCGQEHNHDWPGKADGNPHPRYPR